MSTLSEAIAEKVAQSGPEVKKRVIDALAEDKIKKYTDLMIKGYTELDKLQVQFDKIKPDNKMFDTNGNVVQEGFSSSKNDERKNLTKRIDKLISALHVALEQNKFENLEKFFRGGGEKSDDAASESQSGN